MWKQRLLFLGLSLLILLGIIKGGEPVLTADAPAAIPKEQKYIALTFDDGPRANHATGDTRIAEPFPLL